MNKYDVNLIVDKEGKPMPQYYDEVEGVMKPITRNNFDGSVQVGNFPDIQKVEVTNQKDVQDVNVTNPVNSVEISNFPLTQDVNVINPQKNVTIDNFPSVQNVTDAQVKAELGQIKATQVQILERLNGQLVTEDGAQVVQPKGTESVKYITVRPDVDVGPNEAAYMRIRASIGKIADIVHYGFRALAIKEATGEHRVVVSLQSGASYDRFLDITAEAAQALLISRGKNAGSSTKVIPSDPLEQLAMSMGLTIGDEVGINIAYFNNTTGTQPIGNVVVSAVLNERDMSIE